MSEVNRSVFDEYEKRFPTGYLADSSSSATSIALYGLIRLIQPSVVVEFGTWDGATSIWLARALAENGRGRYIGYEIQPSKVAATEQALKRAVPNGPWTLKNHSPLDEPYIEADFVFMDHEKTQYLPTFFKCMVPVGGYLLAHDTQAWPASVQFYEWMTLQREWEVLNILQERGLMIARKRW